MNAISYIAAVPAGNTMTAIIAEVAREYGITYADMMSYRRNAPLCDARAKAFHRCATETHHSFEAIGRKFNGRTGNNVAKVLRTYRAKRAAHLTKPADTAPPIACCTACGGPLKESRCIVDLSTNTITHNGKTIRIQAQAAEIMHVLREAYPRVVQHDHIRERVLGMESECRKEGWVRDRISWVRSLIKPLGLKIENSFDVGYRLAEV